MNSAEYDSSIHVFLASPQSNINIGSMVAKSVLTRLPSVQEMTVTEVVVDSVVAVVVVEDMEAVAVVDTEVAAAMKTTTPVEVTLEVDTLEVVTLVEVSNLAQRVRRKSANSTY